MTTWEEAKAQIQGAVGTDPCSNEFVGHPYGETICRDSLRAVLQRVAELEQEKADGEFTCINAQRAEAAEAEVKRLQSVASTEQVRGALEKAEAEVKRLEVENAADRLRLGLIAEGYKSEAKRLEMLLGILHPEFVRWLEAFVREREARNG